jgi:uncharacterized membrane protein YesL
MLLVVSIIVAYFGITKNKVFSKKANFLRHWTATIAHIQLIIGIIIYTQSPITKYFWKNFKVAFHNIDVVFFGLVHIFLMLTAIVLITVGSALAKRKPTDAQKYKTMLFWFSVSLVIIFIAIPWPFSPFVTRPYFR